MEQSENPTVLLARAFRSASIKGVDADYLDIGLDFDHFWIKLFLESVPYLEWLRYFKDECDVREVSTHVIGASIQVLVRADEDLAEVVAKLRQAMDKADNEVKKLWESVKESTPLQSNITMLRRKLRDPSIWLA